MSQGNLVRRVEQTTEYAKPREMEGLGRWVGVGSRGTARPWIGEPSPASSDHAHFLRVRQPLWGRGHLQVCFTVFVLLAGYSERGP